MGMFDSVMGQLAGGMNSSNGADLLGGIAGGIMGSKGPSVPGAPDVSGNVKAADKISGTATDQAAQTYTTAQAYNKNAQDSLGKVVGAQTPVMQKLADTTNTNLNTYGQNFVPLQAKQAQDAAAYGSDENIQRMQGMAMGDQAAGAEAARKRSADALASEGVDPASIHGGALDRAAQLEASKNIAGAGTQSALQTKLTGQQMVNQANQLGLQVNGAADAGAQTGSAVGGQLMHDVNNTNSTGISNLTANNGLLDTGMKANRSSADIASQGFGDQMKAYDASTKASGSSGGMFGSLVKMAAPIAMAAMADGGAVGQPVPGAVDGISQGLSMARGGTVSQKGALPYSPVTNNPTDTKPALLTPGEYVIPKDVALHKGHEFFHKMIDKSRLEMQNRQAIPHAPSVGA